LPARHLFAALAMALLFAPAAATADTFTVSAGDAASLQSALNQAAAHPNSGTPDLVAIPAGTYSGNFTYSGDAVDVEGASRATTKLTAASDTTLSLDAPDSTISGLSVASTATTFGLAVELAQGGTVRDAELDALGKNVVGLTSWSTSAVTDVRIVIGTGGDTGLRMFSPATMTISDATLEGSGDGSTGIQASATSSVHVARLRSVGVNRPLRAIFGAALTVRDSLLVLPADEYSQALEAGDNNNPSDSTATVTADRVTVVGDPTANQQGALTLANSAGDDFQVSLHDSVISGVAHPLACNATAGTGSTSADWSSLPATGDTSGGAGCAVARTNAVPGSPVFVDAAGGDYHPRHDSPLIDGGDPAALSPTDDLDGLARPVDRVDLGSYEYQRRPPVVSASADIAAPATGQDVTFSANASDPDPGDSPLTYAWSFDDGTTASAPSTTHAFTGAGLHLGTVTVTDPAGSTASSKVTVTVTAPGSSSAPDHTAPTVTLWVNRRLSLTKALRRGIRAKIGCSEACRFTAAVLLPASTAKRLQIARRVTLGKRSISLPDAATQRLTIRFSHRARTALADLARVKILIRAIATDRAGNTSRTLTRKTTLRR
jgi:PKD domain